MLTVIFLHKSILISVGEKWHDTFQHVIVTNLYMEPIGMCTPIKFLGIRQFEHISCDRYEPFHQINYITWSFVYMRRPSSHTRKESNKDDRQQYHNQECEWAQKQGFLYLDIIYLIFLSYSTILITLVYYQNNNVLMQIFC